MIKTHKLNASKFAALMDIEIITIMPFVLYLSKIKIGGTSTMFSIYITPWFNVSVIIPKRKKQ
jgi:hypothetical protein